MNAKQRTLTATLLTGAALMLFPVHSAHAGDLTLKNVTLSSGGLAQFDWAATVDGGDVSLSLPVRSSQVDDILKSLVVYDTTGSITDVSLAGRESLKQLFTDLPFSQDDLNHPATLLSSLKGQKIAVEGQESVTGRLVNVFKRPVLGKDGETLTHDYILTVLSDKGMKEVTLDNLNAVKFLDPSLNADLERALEAVSEQSNRDTKTVDIRLSGKDKRDVKISYTVPAPLWKAAYRIVLPETGNAKSEAFVQGWAVLENTTGGDWKDVNLSLVSGNPVTYHQALYDSYSVDRPTLPVEIFGRVMPRKDTGDFAVSKREEATNDAAVGFAGAPAPAAAPMMKSMRAARGGIMAAAPAADIMMNESAPAQPAGGDNVALSNEAAGQMVFNFPQKVSLVSGHSMMVPFVNGEYKATRVYLYQPDANQEHPLASLEITNDGKTGLPPGIVTLYSPEEGKGTNTYIGDAQMPTVNAGDERMLSYAVDGKTSIKSEQTSTQHTASISIAGGIMKVSQISENTSTYTVKAPSDEDRTVVIEQPKWGGDWKLTEPKDGAKETATHYRIPVTVKAGAEETVPVTVSRTDYQSFQAADLPRDTLNFYLSGMKDIPDDVRKVLSRMAELRGLVDDFDTQFNELQNTKARITADQERLRANIQAVSQNSDLAKRYLKQMSDQEDHLQSIEEQSAELQSKRADALKRLKDYIADVKI